MNEKASAAVIVMLLCHTVMMASATAEESFANCRDIADDAERLECYDRATGRERERRPAAQADAPMTEPAAATPSVDAAVPAALPSSRAGSSPATAQPGPDASRLSDDSSESEGEPKSITSRVLDVSTRARGEHVVVLENGQVWRQEFASRYFPVEPGDEITVRKQFFGGYRLTTESGKGYRVERVR